MKKIKELILRFKDLMFIGGANITGTAIGTIFWLFIATLLTTKEYGEISYIISIGSIVAAIATLGVSGTILVYTAKGEKVQASYYFISILAAIVSSAILFIILEKIELSLYVIGYVIFSLAISDILGSKKYKNYLKYMISQKIIFVALALILFYLIGPSGIVLGFALSFFPYIIRIYIGFKESKIEKTILRLHFRFTINNYANDLARSLSGNLDKIIIGPLLGFSLLGNYALGMQFLSLLGILPGIVFQYILPQEASGNPSKRIKKYTILISVCIAVLGSFFGPIILPIFLPHYAEAADVIKIISFAVIPITINLMYKSKLLSNNKSFPALLGAITFVTVQIIGIITIGQWYTINGIAMSLLIAATSESVLLFTIDQYLKRNKH